MDHVPNFKCCFDPALEIKLGQVTKVDTDDLKNTLEELMMLESDDNEHDQDESWIIPAQVQVLVLKKCIITFRKKIRHRTATVWKNFESLFLSKLLKHFSKPQIIEF